MIKRWMEITFVLIALYLVLSNSKAFASVVNALTGGYVSMAKVLQGR